MVEADWFVKFAQQLKAKDIKSLTDLELRKEIIFFFDTTSWRKIYETKKTLLALGLIKETRDGYDLV